MSYMKEMVVMGRGESQIIILKNYQPAVIYIYPHIYMIDINTYRSSNFNLIQE